MGVGEQSLPEAECVQHSESISSYVEKGACVVVGFRGGFEDLDVPPIGGQEHRRSWAGNAATDDKCAWHDNSCL
jgi:hypothetical protein